MKIPGFLLYYWRKIRYQTPMLRPHSIGLLLALATLVVYLPATTCSFTNFDDPQYVTENPIVQRGLTWAGVKWAFAGVHVSNWHPLPWLSPMIDCDLFRLNPAGPHLVNILFHALNTALLFALMWRLTAKLWPAAFIAALFAWHPLHVESVAWVAERKDVLSTFWGLLALLAYVRYARGHSRTDAALHKAGGAPVENAGAPNSDSARGEDSLFCAESEFGAPRTEARFYWLSLAFFALSLLSKPMLVTLPGVLLLLDFWPLKRWSFGEWRLKNIGWLLLEKVPFIAFALAVCVITILAQHYAESSLENVPISLRLENTVTAYAAYLGKMIWPLHLSVFYPFHHDISKEWLVEAMAFLTGISLLAWLERKVNPWLLVGWLWYLVTLLPVIGIVQVGGQAMADRYTYFPLIGIFLGISLSAATLAERFSFLKKWLVVVVVLALGTLATLTEKQIGYWRDSESLFRHTLEVEDSVNAHISLGCALHAQNRMPEAMAQFIMAWRLNSESLLANANIAGILAEENKPKLAAVYYQRTIQHNSWLPWAYQNYGRVLVTLKHYDEAMEQFSAAAKVDPSLMLPHFLMAKLWLQKEQDTNAVKELFTALELEPDNLEIMTLTASILAADKNAPARDGTKAYALASEAVKLTAGRSPAALDVLAMAYAELGKFDNAIQTEQQAIKLADEGGMKDDLHFLQKRLELYQQHQPWRDSFKIDSSKEMQTPDKIPAPK